MQYAHFKRKDTKCLYFSVSCLSRQDDWICALSGKTIERMRDLLEGKVALDTNIK